MPPRRTRKTEVLLLLHQGGGSWGFPYDNNRIGEVHRWRGTST